jgi:hypothetical protein
VNSELASMQRSLAAHLRDPDATAPPPGIEDRRLQVYRDLVYRNIKGFIDSTFPVLCSLHDEEDWAALVREFIRDHRCHSPLFLEISEEFLAFLLSRPEDPAMPFMAELAHYEWLELAVDVAEGEVPKAAEASDPGAVSPVLASTARVGSYRFPVHRIGRSFRPLSADEPVSLLVYRDRDDRVQFMELSPAAARLLHEASGETGASARAILERLAVEWGAEPEATVAYGWEQLLHFARAGVIDLLPKGVK